MNTASVVARSIVWLSEGPGWLHLIVRSTAFLALAWAAHAAVAGGNPRWRVALWRSTVVGLAVIAALTAVPPIVTWRVALNEPGRAALSAAKKPARVAVPTSAPGVQPGPPFESRRTPAASWASPASGSGPISEIAVRSTA